LAVPVGIGRLAIVVLPFALICCLRGWRRFAFQASFFHLCVRAMPSTTCATHCRCPIAATCAHGLPCFPSPHRCCVANEERRGLLANRRFRVAVVPLCRHCAAHAIPRHVTYGRAGRSLHGTALLLHSTLPLLPRQARTEFCLSPSTISFYMISGIIAVYCCAHCLPPRGGGFSGSRRAFTGRLTGVGDSLLYSGRIRALRTLRQHANVDGIYGQTFSCTVAPVPRPPVSERNAVAKFACCAFYSMRAARCLLLNGFYRALFSAFPLCLC